MRRQQALGPLGNSAAVNAGSIIFGGGTLQYSAANKNDYSGRFSTAANQPISIDTNGQSVTFPTTALSSSGGTLTKLGAGTLTLSDTNTYTGATTVTSGTLQAGVASSSTTTTGLFVGGAFGKNSAVTMGNVSGATLNITGFNTQIGSLTGGGTTGGNVILGAATLTIGGNHPGPRRLMRA